MDLPARSDGWRMGRGGRAVRVGGGRVSGDGCCSLVVGVWGWLGGCV